jgi:hypothetical protein
MPQSGTRRGIGRRTKSKVLSEGLVEEIPASGSLPVWRRDEGQGPLALRITKLGLKAIAVEDPDAAPGSVSTGTRASVRASGRNKRRSGRAMPRKRKKAAARAQSAGRAKADSKQTVVIALLSRARGAIIAEVMEVTGWQQHSVRGFFASVVRKKLGLNLVSEKAKGDRRYRIVSSAKAKRAA